MHAPSCAHSLASNKLTITSAPVLAALLAKINKLEVLLYVPAQPVRSAHA